MRKLTRNALTATAVVSAALALTAAPASADATITVTQGGIKTANNVGNVIAQNTSTGAVVTCTKSTATANIPNKSDSSMVLGTVTAASFTTPTNTTSPWVSWCTGPAGLFVKITAQTLPWTLTATTIVSGTTTGKLSNVKAKIEASDGCVADITGPSGGPGTIDGKYTNSTGRLTVLGGTSNNLRVNSTNGLCDPLLINVGDAVKLDGVYQVSGASTNWPQIVQTP